MDSQKSPISLKEGALFIADAHYQVGVRQELESLIERLIAHPPPQLFLMGDIFDLLVGSIPRTVRINRPLVQLLQELSLVCECHYFEGNHDFDLGSIFTKMRIYPREEQPVIFEAGSNTVALAHGDLWIDERYERYITTIKKSWVLQTLRLLDVKGWITGWIQRYNATKDLCKRIEDFPQIVERKLHNYPDSDLVIEGHFHQDHFQDRYINLPSFGCEGLYVRYSRRGFERIRHEKT